MLVTVGSVTSSLLEGQVAEVRRSGKNLWIHLEPHSLPDYNANVSVPSTTYEGSTLKVLTWDILLGVRWFDIPRFESLQRFRELQSQCFARLAPHKTVIVSVSIASGELHFDSGSRDLVAALVNDAKTHLHGMAQVVVGDGFGAASVRSVLSGIQLAARPDYPVRVFADVASARPWIEELLVAAGHPELTRDDVLLEFLANLEEAPRAVTR
jgi:hypothetical protein